MNPEFFKRGRAACYFARPGIDAGSFVPVETNAPDREQDTPLESRKERPYFFLIPVKDSK
jgi:hypothetical protein